MQNAVAETMFAGMTGYGFAAFGDSLTDIISVAIENNIESVAPFLESRLRGGIKHGFPILTHKLKYANSYEVFDGQKVLLEYGMIAQPFWGPMK